MPSGPKWMGDILEGIMGSTMRRVIIASVNYLSTDVKLVGFEGDLTGFNFQIGYAVIIRVSETEFRNYTVCSWDIASGRGEIIFHLHGSAPGSVFAEKLQAGDSIKISIPRGQRQYDSKVKKQLIVGDETSLGLAYSFYNKFKMSTHKFQFYFELDEGNESVPNLLGIDNHMVFRKGIFQNDMQVKHLPAFYNDEWVGANFVLSGNVKSVQIFRRVLKESSFPGKIYSKGFWLEGKMGL